MSTKKIIAAALGLIWAAGLAAGQTTPVQDRQKMRENVLTLRLLRLTQALDLNEEQAARIFPMFNKIERGKLQIQKRMSGDIADLRRMLRGQDIKEADLAERLRSIREAQVSARALDEELEAFVEANLTIVQKAKYLLFTIEFYRGLADVLDRAGMRRGQMGNAPPGPIKK